MKMNWPLFLITLIFLLYNYKGFFTSYLTPVITLIFWRSQSSVPSFTFVLHLLFRVEKACESVNKAVWGITASQRVALRATCCRAFNLSLHIGFLLWDVPTSLCLSLFCPPPFFLSSRLSPHLLPHASQTRTYHTGFFFCLSGTTTSTALNNLPYFFLFSADLFKFLTVFLSQPHQP